MPNETCPVCELPAKPTWKEEGLVVECRCCGVFILTSLARSSFSNLAQVQKANLSGWIRENQGCTITEQRIDELLRVKSPSVGEKGDKLLLFLATRFPKPSQAFEVGFSADTSLGSEEYIHAVDLCGVAWAADFAELRFLLMDYLTIEKQALAVPSTGRYTITPKGWSQVAALRQGDIKSDRGFVAMWFDKSMDATDVTIGAAIREAGYRAVRIDRHEHNNHIDDEILANIRRSKFVVADLTGQRGGVYFEAGFALGLGIPVIWLCRKDDLARIHFDNRQYNFVLWEEDKQAELLKALRNRIEATIGRGPWAENT